MHMAPNTNTRAHIRHPPLPEAALPAAHSAHKQQFTWHTNTKKTNCTNSKSSLQLVHQLAGVFLIGTDSGVTGFLTMSLSGGVSGARHILAAPLALPAALAVV